MKNLLPGFILENFKNNKFEGEADAFTLYSDISGFTAMSSLIMKGENEGAEILSGILKKIYSPAVRLIHDHNGFITNFAGDGFISVFITNKNDLKQSAINVLACAQSIINEMNNSGIHKTRFGNFKLKTKTGLSFGIMEWAIVGDKIKSYYFKGNAVSGCSESIKRAGDNEIIADINFYNTAGIKKMKNIQTVKKESGYFCLSYEKILNSYRTSAVNINKISGITKEVFSSKFIHPAIFSLKDSGQFRNVVSLFLSFDLNTPVNKLTKLFSLIINSANQNSGYLKDIDFGDKGGVIVVFFGVPNTSERDLIRAMRFLKNIKTIISTDEDLQNIQIKIGMTFGGAFVGFIGDESREQYSVIGDTVNLASRFMVYADVNEIIVNEGFVKNYKDGYQFKYVGNEFFKGFSESVPVYKFEFENNDHSLKEGINVLVNKEKIIVDSEKIIGREEELKKLTELSNSIIKSNNSGVIYIVGEPGIGKSRLLKEFRKNYSQPNKVTWLYCRTSEIIKESLSPLKFLLKNFFKQSSQNTNVENKILFDNIIDIIIKRLDNETIENKSEAVNIELIKSELNRTRSVIGAMIDLKWENSLHEQLEPELRFENMIFSFCNLIMAECTLQPVIFEIEDIHWLDKDSMKVINMLLNNIINLPLVVICSSRYLTTENRLNNSKNGNIPEYEIYPSFFNLEYIRELCGSILSFKIDTDTSEFIMQNTNGNPYFVEQLILDLKERNLLVKKNKSFALSASQYSGIPQSINNVLISRFDRLPKNVKEIIMVASVLGREFDIRILKMILAEDTRILKKIKIAEVHKICYPQNEIKYYFTHSLLRDAVYGMQMPTELNLLHRQTANAIKKLYGKKISYEKLTQVAFHTGIGYGIANVNGKIIFNKADLKKINFKRHLNEYLQYLNLISEKHKKEYRNEKAIEVFDIILKILDKLNDYKQAFDILLRKAEVLNNISKWNEAENIVNAAVRHANFLKDNYLIMTGNKYLADVLRHKNEFGRSMAIYKKCLKSSILKQTDEKFSILQGLGIINKELGNFKKAEEIFQIQFQISKAEKDKVMYSTSLYNLGTVSTNTGKYDDALRYFRESLNLSKNFSFLNRKALIHKSIGNVYFFKGDLKRSLESFKEALKLFKETGNRSEYGNTLGNMGNLEFTNKNFERAENYFKEQLNIFKQINNISGLSSAYGNMGNLYSAQFKLQDALKNYEMQLKINISLKMQWSLAVAYGNIGIVHFQLGDFTKAINFFKKQLKLAKVLSNPYGVLNASINIGNSYHMQKNFIKGKLFYEDALKIADDVRNKNIKTQILFNYTESLIKMDLVNEALKICLLLISLCKKDKELKLKANIMNEILILLGSAQEIISKVKLADKKKSELTTGYFIAQIKKIMLKTKDFQIIENTADAYYKLNEICSYLHKAGLKISLKEEIKNKTFFLFSKLFSETPKHEYKIILKELKDQQ